MLSHSYSNALDNRECSCTFMVIKNEYSRTFATFPAPPKCPCLGGTHSSIIYFLLQQHPFRFILLGISFSCSSSLHSKGYRCMIDLCKMFLLGIITFVVRFFLSWLLIISMTHLTLYIPLVDESFT